MAPSKFLASLSHAAAGSAASVVATSVTYPLDLVNTRIKVQRAQNQQKQHGVQIRQKRPSYTGPLDALVRIYRDEGGLSALWDGIGADAAKASADSFLWFLFYTWFRARRRRRRHVHSGRGPPELGEDGDSDDVAAVVSKMYYYYLGALEELAVGSMAGACARFLTTPVGNAVTRRQIGGSGGKKTLRQTMGDMWDEGGVVNGLWAGYSASLVLTLNPSITFFLQQLVKKAVVPREDWDETGSGITFLLAALSKVAATGLTYPFQMAKARIVAVSPAEASDEESQGGVSASKKGAKERWANGHNQVGSSTGPNIAQAKRSHGTHAAIASLFAGNIFTTVYDIARNQGCGALYDGISGEIVKAFFNHGMTMLSKDLVHQLIVQLYLAVVGAIRRQPEAMMRLLQVIIQVRMLWRRQVAIAQGFFWQPNGLQRGPKSVSR